MARRTEEQLAEVAHLYYEDDRTQGEIAEHLQTTRSNVSRMLTAARERGLVRIQVLHPVARQTALEERLVATFGIDEAVVLAADAGAEVLSRTGQLAAGWLTSHLRDGMTVTLSWGRTLKALADQLSIDQAHDVEVVQVGGDLQLDPRLSGHELVREVAARLGGRYSYLHAPAILDSPTTVADLRGDRGIAAQLEKARCADLALVGIGGFGHGSSDQIVTSAHLSAAERRALEVLAPAGDIAARFFDAHGREIHSPLRDRVLGLDLDALAAIPVVVGVAAGEEKTRGVWAALRGRLVDVVICDQVLAASALHLERTAT